VRSEVWALFVGSPVRYPAFFRAADKNASVIASEAGKFFGQSRNGNDVPGFAAIQAVAQISDCKQGGRGYHDGAKLESREHDLPNRDQIGQLDDKAVTAPNSLLTQEI